MKTILAAIFGISALISFSAEATTCKSPAGVSGKKYEVSYEDEAAKLVEVNGLRQIPLDELSCTSMARKRGQGVYITCKASKNAKQPFGLILSGRIGIQSATLWYGSVYSQDAIVQTLECSN